MLTDLVRHGATRFGDRPLLLGAAAGSAEPDRQRLTYRGSTSGPTRSPSGCARQGVGLGDVVALELRRVPTTRSRMSRRPSSERSPPV